jgi:hypothetical protein
MLLKELFEYNQPQKYDVLYHVSPLPKFDGTRETSQDAMDDLYNSLYDELETIDDVNEYENKANYLKKIDQYSRLFSKGKRFHDDISDAPKDSFYATSQPEYWQSVMEDEHGTDYSHGGIYKVYLKNPQSEDYVPSGMGQKAPQAIVNINNVVRITGPFKTLKQTK